MPAILERIARLGVACFAERLIGKDLANNPGGAASTHPTSSPSSPQNVIRERDFKDHFSYWLDLMAEDGDRMELTKRKVLWDYFGNIYAPYQTQQCDDAVKSGL